MELDKFVGMTKEEFKEAVNPKYWRVVKEDGEYFIVTMDMNPTRYNLEIEEGLITKVYMA